MTCITSVIYMNDVTLIKKGNINKSKTTITVRLGTKHQLQEVANKNESFDDVISRLISSNRRLEKELENCRSILKSNNLDNYNIIESFESERGIDSIKLSNGDQIRFTYNKPAGWPYDESYQMDIDIEKVFSDRKNALNQLKKDPEQWILIHFWMVGRIINRHFDNAFEIPMNKNLIDTEYWRKVWDRNKLPESSYLHDIIKEIERYEDSLNG